MAKAEILNLLENKKLNIDLMKEIFNVPSPSGFTHHAIDFLDNYISKLGYKTSRNQKGNLIVEVEGKTTNTLGLSAHVDTLGLMVRSIRGDGHLSFTTVGGILLPTVDGEYCTVHTRDGKTYSGTILSTSPSVHVYSDSRTKGRDINNMYIRLDEVVNSKNDTLKLGIGNGDFVTIDPKFTYTSSGYIKTRFLDDKASVFVLVELLKLLKEENIVPTDNLRIIFSTYEEVGHGAANIPSIDKLLVIDMGCIGLDLSCTEHQVSICAKDSSGPYDYKMTSELIQLAKDNELNYAVDVYPFYGSDGSAALSAGNDIKAALIGAGIHASHGMERTHYEGLLNTLKLVLLYITK